jgi:hypothetical protein
MTMLPLKTAISDTYPNPSNTTARAGFAQLWDALNEATQAAERDLASSATTDIGGQLSTKLRITGTNTISSFGTNYRGPIFIRMSGALIFTHNSTTLRCPGGASYTTTANEVMAAWPIASTSGTFDGWQLVTLGGGAVSGVAAITSGSITGITDLAIADGGTGASTAATAFSNLKQAASTTATGVVELATDAEAQAGTDATRCVTPDNLGAVVLGLGQTWQDLTASRAITTTYTNSTGRAIAVNVSITSTVAAAIRITINGALIHGTGENAGTVFLSVGIIIPAGATYAVTASGGTATLQQWYELR